MSAAEDKSEWVAIVLGEGEAETPIEIQSEPDGTLLLTSITAQFPGTTGLKFCNESTGSIRGIRCQQDVLFPPSKEGWGAVKYVCVRPEADEKKRKLEEEGASSSYKSHKALHGFGNDEILTTDLICLGLPFKTTEEQVRQYFADFGDLMFVQLKRKSDGSSKGFAFVRFKDKKVQDKALLTRHYIDERWCDLKLPDSQQQQASSFQRKDEACKIFVARISEAIKPEDIQQHFEQFGQVTDVFYPEKPFRGFAFVTFVESRVAQSLIGKDHVIKGVSVHIGSANAKTKSRTGTEASEEVGDGGGAAAAVAAAAARYYERAGAVGQQGYRGYPGGPWSLAGMPPPPTQQGPMRGGYY